MAQYEHLPIYKAALDLSVYFEGIVKNFSRYHKYTHGRALRNLSREALMLIVRANNVRDRLPVLEDLRIKMEELKVVIRICKEVKAFPNFNSFEVSVNYILNIADTGNGPGGGAYGPGNCLAHLYFMGHGFLLSDAKKRPARVAGRLVKN